MFGFLQNIGLPEIARSIGKSFKELKKGIKEVEKDTDELKGLGDEPMSLANPDRAACLFQ